MSNKNSVTVGVEGDVASIQFGGQAITIGSGGGSENGVVSFMVHSPDSKDEPFTCVFLNFSDLREALENAPRRKQYSLKDLMNAMLGGLGVSE